MGENHIQFFDSRKDEDLLTKCELAEKLKFSVSNVDKLMKYRKIPTIKVGKSVRFKYSDVVAALQKGSAV